jgi:uncharacterized protein (DUF1786 family)
MDLPTTPKGGTSDDSAERTIGYSLQRRWLRDNSPKRQLENDSVPQWDEEMATCFAHLKSALSAIEELTHHPGSSLGDAYFYDQASASVWVALVALDACNPTVVNAAGHLQPAKNDQIRGH